MARPPPLVRSDNDRILLAVCDLGTAGIDEIRTLLQKRSRLFGIVPTARVPDRQALMESLNALIGQGFLYVDHAYLLTPKGADRVQDLLHAVYDFGRKR